MYFYYYHYCIRRVRNLGGASSKFWFIPCCVAQAISNPKLELPTTMPAVQCPITMLAASLPAGNVSQEILYILSSDVAPHFGWINSIQLPHSHPFPPKLRAMTRPASAPSFSVFFQLRFSDFSVTRAMSLQLSPL